MSGHPVTRQGTSESGNAILEFVFVAVLCFAPMVYVIVAVETVLESMAAVTQAARDAGRAFATAESTQQGEFRARVAVRLDMADHGLPDDAQIKFVSIDAGCDAPAVEPALTAAARYRVCVSRRSLIPAVPSIAQGRGLTTQGEFDLYIDDYLVVHAR